MTQSTTITKTDQSEPQQSQAPTTNGGVKQKAPVAPSTRNDQQKKDEGKSGRDVFFSLENVRFLLFSFETKRNEEN